MNLFARSRHNAPTSARVLAASEWPEALRLAQQDPVAYVLALTHLERGIRDQVMLGEVWGFPAQGPLAAVCWVGANMIPIVPNYSEQRELRVEALRAFKQLATSTTRRPSSIVGPRVLVLELWDQLSDVWRKPREIRQSQPSMVMREPSDLVESDPLVRFARFNEWEQILPASVHMFIEEVGISPLTFGSSQYSMRVQELVAQGHTVVRMSNSLPDELAQLVSSADGDFGRQSAQPVAFKADFGAVTAQVAQVQGVWVNPLLRGHGLAKPAMAATVALGLSQIAPVVSLYVNDYNTRALAVYKGIGFEQVGEYATVLF